MKKWEPHDKPFKFLSARPGRGATRSCVGSCPSSKSFYPHAPSGARHALKDLPKALSAVSIRTPRTGRDLGLDEQVDTAIDVSIRTPRAGRDTIPGRTSLCPAVSIRTPRAGRDRGAGRKLILCALFLSARPGRGATGDGFQKLAGVVVSIRTLRAGRDAYLSQCNCSAIAFLSARPGRGATPWLQDDRTPRLRFYPHAPGGARRNTSLQAIAFSVVSIRTPRAGRD